MEKDNLIVTHFGGLHKYRDAKKALRQLLKINRGRKEIYEIVINDDDFELEFSRAEERLLVIDIESVYGKFKLGAMAVVATNDLIFGLSRMLSSSINNERIVISVFRSEELARKWIMEIRELQAGFYEKNEKNEGRDRPS